MSLTLGDTHYANHHTNWNIICGQDKNEIFFGRWGVSYTENLKYVTCKKCIEANELIETSCTMTRQEVIDALTEGKKIRHKYFTPNEWIQMDKASAKIFSEDGVCWGHLYDEGMETRKGGFWETDWELFKEQENG